MKPIKIFVMLLLLSFVLSPADAILPEEAPKSDLDRFDVGKLRDDIEPIQEEDRTVWEYELVVSDEELRLADGTLYKVWAFDSETPGPTLLAREEDWVRITLINETSVAHTIHSHGLFVPLRMDGIPHHSGMSHGTEEHEMPSWTRPVEPGESYTYEYIARPAGTHFYHCHANTNEHLDRGMSGALIVMPRHPEPEVDHDMIFLLDEWDSRYAQKGTPGQPDEQHGYDFFTINGRSYPDTSLIEMELGEVLRLRLINAGAMAHYMHLHGHTFLVTHRDGAPLYEPVELDTVAVGPGQRADILIVGNNPGLWCFHCHTVSHVTNAGEYPGGMFSHIKVGAESFPNEGQGPVLPGIESIRQKWRQAARNRA